MNRNDSLINKYLRYIIPAMAGQLIFTLYTVVDGIFVARGVSETALAAVSIATPFITLLFAISITFAVGTSTIVARLLGQNRTMEARRVFTESLVSLVLLSIVISVLVFIFLNPLCRLLGTTESTLPYVRSYLLTIAPVSYTHLDVYKRQVYR